MDFYYYEYFDNVMCRFNVLGVSKMVDDESFGDMIDNIDVCIVFMNSYVCLEVFCIELSVNL